MLEECSSCCLLLIICDTGSVHLQGGGAVSEALQGGVAHEAGRRAVAVQLGQQRPGRCRHRLDQQDGLQKTSSGL
jgi:hypothetical protein